MATTDNQKSPSALEALVDTTRNELHRFRDELDSDKVKVNEKVKELTDEIRKAVLQIRLMIRQENSLGADKVKAMEDRLSILESHLDEPPASNMSELLQRIGSGLGDVLRPLADPKTYKSVFPHLYDTIYRYRLKVEILMIKVELERLTAKEIIQKQRKKIDEALATWEAFWASRR